MTTTTARDVEIFLVDPPIADTDALNKAISDPAHPLHRQARMWHRQCFSPVYEPTLNYRLAISYRMGLAKFRTAQDVANHAFEMANIGQGPLAQRYRAGGNRSLSVGDIVVVDGRAWLCARFGWERIEHWHRPVAHRPRRIAA